MTVNTAIGRFDTHQSVAFTGTAGTTSAVGAQTRKLRIVVTAAAYVRVGAGAATTADVYFPVSVAGEYVICNPGQTVSAIQAVGAGVLHVTEVTN
jgi:hypothetical protein